MARDSKYGRITVEKPPAGMPFGDDEPLVLFRGTDGMLVDLLDHYYDLCEDNGSPSEHVAAVFDLRDAVMVWQRANPDRVKQPD